MNARQLDSKSPRRTPWVRHKATLLLLDQRSKIEGARTRADALERKCLTWLNGVT